MTHHIQPCTLREARAFVEQHHRHHAPPQGGLFAAAVACSEVCGVVIVGVPVARMVAADDYTAEVTRLCTLSHPNTSSMLYGAAWRAARALGYRRLITYTLPEEGGGSLRASGFKLIGEAGGGTWSRKSRLRVDTHPTQVKLRWEVTL